MSAGKALISEYETRLAQADALLKEKLKRVEEFEPLLKEKDKALKAIESRISEKSTQLEKVEKPPESLFSVLFADGSAGVFPKEELQPVQTIPKDQFDTLTSLLSGESRIDDTDPYLTYPDESKKWKGMVHCHGRGRSVHLDFRAQISSEYATGWTLFIPKGLSKVPANYAEFKRLVDAEIMPLVKDTMSNPMKKFNCGKKAPEPIEWLSYQGMVQPGEIGATKNEPGFFYIIDSFEVQFGAQKSYFHEYFCNRKIFKGRLIFRLLKNREEWKKTDEGLMTWMAFNALKSPTPYVLSTRAVSKQWVPPVGISALPRNIRTKIPEKFQYWKVKDNRRQVRDALVAEIKKKLIKLDSVSRGQFKFLKQTWRGQKVIREGPSRTQFYFVFKHGDNYFALAVNSDLSASTSVTGVPFSHGAALFHAEGELHPGSKLNPTKATPSKMEVLDSGSASVLSEGKLSKFVLKGKKLTGVWIASQQKDSDMWSIVKAS